jgi:dTDP-4-dehydrorhamnose reductase
LISRSQPDWVVLTAAYTDVDGSERNPEQAFAVNAQGTENVARTSQELGSRLLFVSTDYVFDGRATRPYEPDDPIAPITVYGQSNALGEKVLQKFHKEWCIVRTSVALRCVRRMLSRENPSSRRDEVGAHSRS